MVMGGFLLFYDWVIENYQLLVDEGFWWVVLLPMVGFPLAYALVYYCSFSRTTGCATHTVLDAYHVNAGDLHWKDSVTKAAGAILTIGSGGSAGLEGPSMIIGGGIAAQINRKLRLAPEDRRKLFMAGTAAGLAAYFHAPLTGLFFGIEVPYRFDLAREVFLEAAIASVTGYAVSGMITRKWHLFELKLFTGLLMSPTLLAHSIVIGFLCAILGMLFIKMYVSMHRNLSPKVGENYWMPFAGGVAMACLSIAFLFVGEPVVLQGGGEPLIEELLMHAVRLTPLLALILAVAKIVATSVTLNTGGSGGVIGPSLFVGAMIGYAYAGFLHLANPEIYMMIAMASFLASVTKCLVTGVALVAETCGTATIIPTVVATAVSFFAVGAESLYENQLSHHGVWEEEALIRAYYRARQLRPHAVQRLYARNLMITHVPTVHLDHTVREALAHRFGEFHMFPVVDDRGHLVGSVNLEDLLAVSERSLDLPVTLAAVHSAPTISPDAPIEEVIHLLEDHGTDVYVVDEEGRLLGVITAPEVVRRLIAVAGISRRARRLAELLPSLGA